jgi:hypothetical protein
VQKFMVYSLQQILFWAIKFMTIRWTLHMACMVGKMYRDIWGKPERRIPIWRTMPRGEGLYSNRFWRTKLHGRGLDGYDSWQGQVASCFEI